MEITLRNYSANDLEEILNITNFYIRTTAALYDYAPRTIEFQENFFAEKLQKGFQIIVAIYEEKVVGFGYFGEFRMREAYKYTVEHSIYVHQEHTHKGIGKLLLKELIHLAKAKNLHSMIGVIDSENKSSIDFHEQFGFKIVGIIPEVAFKFDRWLNCVLVQKLL